MPEIHELKARQVKNAITAHIQNTNHYTTTSITYYHCPAGNSNAAYAYLLRESFSATDGDNKELKNRYTTIFIEIKNV